MNKYARYALLTVVLIWVSLFAINVYKAFHVAWKTTQSTVNMHRECQTNPTHREMYYAICVEVEQRRPSTPFWIQLAFETARYVHPFIFFDVHDIFTVKGMIATIIAFFVQRFFRELSEVLIREGVQRGKRVITTVS